MFNLFQKMTCVVALLLPLPAFAADAPSPEAGQKAKLEFVRSSGMMALLKARVDVNGRRVGEIGKGEATNVLIEPGRTLIKVDSAFSPGQFTFSFTTEKGAEYRFEIIDSMDKVDAEYVFGSPPKVVNGEVLESGGVLKVTMSSANLPKPVEPEPAPVIQPVKDEPVAEPAPVVNPVKVEPVPEPVSAPLEKTPPTIEDQLRALKRLYDQELISKEIYMEKQQKILEGLK